MSLNADGISTIVTGAYEVFDYIAYGVSSVGDNDTELGDEIGRVESIDKTTYSTYFTILSSIDSTTANGRILSEFGLAVADTGDISSTQNYYPIIKTDSFEILIYSTIIVSNLI